MNISTHRTRVTLAFDGLHIDLFMRFLRDAESEYRKSESEFELIYTQTHKHTAHLKLH